MSIWLRAFGRIALTVLAAGLLSATLARYAPGFGSDEEQLDARRSAESKQRIERIANADRDLLAFTARTFVGYLHGDLGYSRSLNRPIKALFQERLAPSLVCLSIGCGTAWLAGFGLVLFSLIRAGQVTRTVVEGGASCLQCLPAAVLALLMIGVGGRGALLGGLTLGLVLAPRVIFYSGNLLRQAFERTHVLAARARGLSRSRAVFQHALPAAYPQLLSFFGVSISLAASAAIPVEVILDIPGIGQLAWQAALARDLSLLLAITILLSLLVTVSNAAAESLGHWTAVGGQADE